MRKLTVFNQVSLDGYFVDAAGDMSWAKKSDPEWNAFVADNASNAGSLLLFGRITYQMMAAFWPSALARQVAPVVAEGMNSLPKVVFSRTLSEATWHNTRLIKDDLVGAVQQLKQVDGKHIAIMGSGTIVAQLAAAGLIDEYTVVVNPLVLGQGRTMFEGLRQPLGLKLVKTRVFENGNVLLNYTPA